MLYPIQSIHATLIYYLSQTMALNPLILLALMHFIKYRLHFLLGLSVFCIIVILFLESYSHFYGSTSKGIYDRLNLPRCNDRHEATLVVLVITISPFVKKKKREGREKKESEARCSVTVVIYYYIYMADIDNALTVSIFEKPV